MDQQHSGPPPIDRRRLKRDLEAVAKLVAKIAATQIKSFVKQNEIDLPIPNLVLSQGLRLILLSKVDSLCRLPDPELRNVLKLTETHIAAALGAAPAMGDREFETLHKIPALRSSIERVVEAMVQGASAQIAAPDEPSA